jgi:DNA-binding HxlR family transcriptional regulator
LNIVGDRWTLLVLRDLIIHRKRHFRDLLASEERIASNILTTLLPAMLEFARWGAKYDASTAAPKDFLRRIQADRDAAVRELRAPHEGRRRK